MNFELHMLVGFPKGLVLELSTHQVKKHTIDLLTLILWRQKELFLSLSHLGIFTMA